MLVKRLLFISIGCRSGELVNLSVSRWSFKLMQSLNVMKHKKRMIYAVILSSSIPIIVEVFGGKTVPSKLCSHPFQHPST